MRIRSTLPLPRFRQMVQMFRGTATVVVACQTSPSRIATTLSAPITALFFDCEIVLHDFSLGHMFTTILAASPIISSAVHFFRSAHFFFQNAPQASL